MADGNSDNQSDRPEKRRRRIWLRLLILAAGLGLLVWSAPYIASVGFVSRAVLRLASSQLQGQIEADKLSLTWSGPVRLSGLRVTGPGGERVLTADSAESSAGLWAMMTDALQFGQVDVRSAEMILHVEPDLPLPLIEAFRPVRPPKEPVDLPRPRGTVSLHDGSVSIVRGDNRQILGDISLDLRLNTLDDICATLAATLAEGRLEGDVRVRGLIRDGKIDPLAAEARGTLSTETEVDLSQLARDFAGTLPADLTGSAGMDSRFSITGDRAEGQLALRLHGLSSGSAQQAGVRPIDVVLDVDGAWTPEKLRGGLRLDKPGSLRADFETDTTRWRVGDFHDVPAAILSGAPAGLPWFRLAVNGELDIAEIASAVPSVLKLRPDVEITAGKLRIEDFIVSGGDWPSASGRISTEATVAGRRSFTTGPVDVGFHAASIDSAAPELSAELASAFLKASATTTDEGLQARMARLDLDELYEQLTAVFDVGDLVLAGQAEGEVAIAVQRPLPDDLPEELPFQGRLSGSNLLIAGGARRFEATSMRAEQAGMLAMSEGAPKALELTSASLSIDDVVSVSGPAAVDFNDRSWSIGPGFAARADLPRLAEMLHSAGLPTDPDTIASGQLNWSGHARSENGTISTDGQGTLTDLRLGDQTEPLLDGPVAFSHRLSLPVDLESVDIQHAAVSAEGLAAEVTGTVADLAGRVVTDLSGSYSGDWRRLTEIVHRLVPQMRDKLTVRGPAEGNFVLRGPLMDADREIALTDLEAETAIGWSSATAWGIEFQPTEISVALKDAVASIDGQGTLTDLRIGDQAEPLLDGPVAFSHRLSLPVDLESVDIQHAAVSAEGLAAEVTGTVEDLAGRVVTDLSGSYSGDWRLLTEIVHRLAPQMRDKLTVRGPAEGTFVLRGPLMDADREFALTDLEAETAIGWSSATAWGIEFKPTEISVALKDAVASIDGQGTLTDPRIGDQTEPLLDDPVTFSHRLSLPVDLESVDIQHAAVSAEGLAAEVTGTVEDLAGRVVTDLSGSYSGDWRLLTEIVHRLAPQMRDKLTVRGPAEGTFVLRGPLMNADRQFALTDLEAETSIGWSSATAWGLELQRAGLSVRLRDGLAQIDGEPVPTAGDGFLRLPLMIDLRGDIPILRLREPADIVEAAPVTPATGREFISYVNPIFANLAGMEGLLSLRLEDLRMPLAADAVAGGAGRGRLDLSRMTVKSAGILAELLRLTGVSPDRERSLVIPDVDFRIADARVHYRDFPIRVGDLLDLVFSGSVGFDDTVDMAVSVPVRAELLRRLGVGGRFMDYARVLEGARIEIPIIGTRLTPRLDLSQVDVTDLISQAAQLLMLERLRGSPEEPETPDPTVQQEPPRRPRRIDPLLDILRDELERSKRPAENDTRDD